jgi:nitrite reductase (NO-forming)
MTSLKPFALCFLAAAAVAAPDAETMKRGAAAYAKGTCIACHQATGAGLPGVFPPLAGSEWVAKDASIAVRNILHGLQGPIVVKGATYGAMAMPALPMLSDKEIADVVTYVSNSWGNAGPSISEEEVKSIRKKYAGRNKAWTAAEYEKEAKEAPAKK